VGGLFGPPFPSLFSDRDIGETEICSLGQQRLTSGFGQGVGEAVSEIQGGGVAALAVLAPGGAGEVGLFGVYGYDLKIRAEHEEIELASSGFTATGFENDSGFEHGGGGDEAGFGGDDVGEEALTFWFVEKNGDEGRGINNHGPFGLCPFFGLPRASIWKPVIVVAEDLVLWPWIKDGHRVHVAKNVIQLAGQDLGAALVLEPVQTFLQGSQDGPGQGFAGLGRDLPSQAFCFHTFDTNGHTARSIP
jgi:hypothetical protein